MSSPVAPAKCGCCGQDPKQSAQVVVIVVWTSRVAAYPLIPDEAYTVCLHGRCCSIANFVGRAVASHEKTRGSMWHTAIVTFADKSTFKLEIQHAVPGALA